MLQRTRCYYFFAEFYRLPGEYPEHETNLQPDEIITAVDLPAVGWAKRLLKTARVALGGVAHKPWHATEAEERLTGERPMRRRSRQPPKWL